MQFYKYSSSEMKLQPLLSVMQKNPKTNKQTNKKYNLDMRNAGLH